MPITAEQSHDSADLSSSARTLLAGESRALLTRLARLRPFVLHETMVPAAALAPAAMRAVEHYLAEGRRELRARVIAYTRWLESPAALEASPEELQRRFTFVRLRFNAVLSHFDIFADVLTQRSEHQAGVWLAGLDVLATDALELPGSFYDAPPVICYLDRGHGAAIRRARTRLPGGGDNPVGIIRVPRERLIGSGIGSSLIHEVGHQGAQLLDLVESLRPVLRRAAEQHPHERIAWELWERWISEIVADLWSVARIGISSTIGLMGVVSLPRAFVFRLNTDDPHPSPWLRVLVSCALGATLFPHPQWSRAAALWRSFYPVHGDIDPVRRRTFALLEATLTRFVTLLVTHRPASLRGRTVAAALVSDDRPPAQLLRLYRSWGGSFTRMRTSAPTLALAAIGQARFAGLLRPDAESRILADLLTYWAMQRALRPDIGDTLRTSRNAQTTTVITAARVAV